MTLNEVVRRLTLFMDDHADSPVVDEWLKPLNAVYSDDGEGTEAVILLFGDGSPTRHSLGS